LNTRLVDYPNGAKVPEDEQAVASARAAHLNAKAAIAVSAPVVGVATPHAASEFKYTGPLNLNTRLVDYPNGAKVPEDEQAVASARAAHLSAKAAISVSAPVGVGAAAAYDANDFKYTGPLNLNTRLVDYPNGAKVPEDEQAVASARAAHLSAKAAIAVSSPVVDVATPHADSEFKYTGPLNLNTRLVDYPNGAKVPEDEQAVASARAAHLSAKSAIPVSAPVVGVGAAPFAVSGLKYAGPLNLNTRLVDYPNGAKVPADEPAVAAARASHLKTKATNAVSSFHL